MLGRELLLSKRLIFLTTLYEVVTSCPTVDSHAAPIPIISRRQPREYKSIKGLHFPAVYQKFRPRFSKRGPMRNTTPWCSFRTLLVGTPLHIFALLWTCPTPLRAEMERPRGLLVFQQQQQRQERNRVKTISILCTNHCPWTPIPLQSSGALVGWLAGGCQCEMKTAHSTSAHPMNGTQNFIIGSSITVRQVLITETAQFRPAGDGCGGRRYARDDDDDEDVRWS